MSKIVARLALLVTWRMSNVFMLPKICVMRTTRWNSHAPQFMSFLTSSFFLSLFSYPSIALLEVILSFTESSVRFICLLHAAFFFLPDSILFIKLSTSVLLYLRSFVILTNLALEGNLALHDDVVHA